MNQIRVTKEFHFEAAHALTGYDGPCRNIHGHSYVLSVTVVGSPSVDPDSSKLGMVIDFGDLKRIVKKEIVDVYDHALILHDISGNNNLPTGDPFRNVIYVPYQPTSENLLIDFAARIKLLLPASLTLFSIRLRETATSYAEWFASDNL
jgi:6-pyruvoyltetrahydropterin/6-carboxytetrahydropterin synthase